MAAIITNYQAQKWLNETFGGTAYAAPATLYFGLLTDTNTSTQRKAGTVTEMGTGVWSNYARVAATNNTTNFPSISGTARSQTNAGTAIAFGTATASGNVVATAVAVYDAASAGNLLAVVDLTSTSRPGEIETTDLITSPAHGFVAGNKVKFSTILA